MSNPTEQIKKDAEKWEETLDVIDNASEFTKEVFDEETEEKVRYIPTPNFTDCGSADSQLPINVANETITVLSKYRSEFDFIDFVKEKLNYNSRTAVCMAFFSEQIDAIVLAIKQYESGKALILGDMAGLGKGRVCAGLIRYVFQQGVIPVFITEKENLFSDIFRDIEAIGGFGGGIKPKPFIMNPLERKRVEGTDGIVKTININDIVDDNGNVLFSPLSNNEISNLVKPTNKSNYNVTFPFKGKNKDYDFNCVFLTYSVISQTRGESGDNKKSFLKHIAPNSFFILDECHNASGESNLGIETKILVTDAKGVLFSSATYAKNPQSFPLYIIRTSMNEAQIDVANLEKAIGVGGENVSEYIASVLVKEGQMIRREKDFRGCEIGNIFDGSDKIGREAEEVRQRIYSTFNSAVLQFKEIYNYVRGAEFINAIESAIMRKANELGIDLANQGEYELAKSGKDKENAQQEFISKNRGKYIIARVEKNTLGANTKFHFSENLFLAIKSKFTADAVIKELHSEGEYTYRDGKKKKSNRKPVIAIRATGESLFAKLNLKKGDKIKNNFSEYIKAIVSGVKEGTLVFRKVNNDLYVPSYKMVEDGKSYIQEEVKYEIIGSDFEDGGEELDRLIQSVMDYETDIPLSPIDYIMDRIQSVQRASWDRFGSQSVNFKVGEVTARNFSLIKDRDSDLWIYSPNEREKSVKKAFNSFNSGKTDVLIINSSGSTGGSIHSSEFFSDQRPRVMFIPQVELNVSTEVQKRGRINRSGQVNNPAYIYVLSQVPSEIRKFLSLKKKLRRLDANTSANQTQNSNIIDIKNKDGQVVEDVFNKYGEEAFLDFISNDNIDKRYKEIFETINSNVKANVFKEEVSLGGGDIIEANMYSFTRELELYPCDLQEDFYNTMNVLYNLVVDTHINEGTYQLELDTDDLKASLQSRLVRQLNSGKSEFSKPLFIEDKYCLQRRRKWSKEKVDAEIIKMATNFYKNREDEFQNLSLFHTHLIEDFELEYANYIADKDNELKEKEPVRNDFRTEEEFNEAFSEYETDRLSKLAVLDSERSMIYDLLAYYKPNRNIEFVTSIGEGEESYKSYNYGKFIGYSIKQTGKHKYTKGSIYFKFAFMRGDVPSAEININKNGDVLRETKRHSTLALSSTQLRQNGETQGEFINNQINEWKVDTSKRDILRFLSGNILSAIEVANDMKRNKEIKRWALVKYTNADGTLSTSIRLDYKDSFSLIKSVQEYSVSNQIKISVSLDNPNIMDYLKDTPLGFSFSLLVDTMNGIKVRNLIKIWKSKTDMNTIGVEIFQGFPDAKKDSQRLVAEPNKSDANNPIYFAPFIERFNYEQKEYEIIKRRGRGVTSAYFVYSPSFTKKIVIDDVESVGVKAKAGISKIFKFENINEDEGARKLKLFFDGLLREQKFVLDFPQSVSDYYNVVGEGDKYVSKKEKEKDVQKIRTFDEGDYEYKLEVDYDSKYSISPPPTFKAFVKGKTPFDKGTVILGQPILPSFAVAYHIYPYSLSDKSTMQLLLSIFSQDEKNDFIRMAKEKVEAGESASKIGDFVSTTARSKSVPDLKYIFGKRRTNEIGELVKSYILNDELSKMSYVVDDDAETIVIAKKKNKITIEDADKFINYLLF